MSTLTKKIAIVLITIASFVAVIPSYAGDHSVDTPVNQYSNRG